MEKDKPKAMIPVDRIIGVTELRYKFKESFESVKTGEPILIFRGGKKKNLVIITEEEYKIFTEFQQTLKK